MYFARKQVAGSSGCERLKWSSMSVRCRQSSSIDLKKTGHVQNVTCACTPFNQLKSQRELDPVLHFMQSILDGRLDRAAPRAHRRTDHQILGDILGCDQANQLSIMRDGQGFGAVFLQAL